MKTYRELDVWQGAMNLADLVFDAVEEFPKSQKYVLSDQIQRSAVRVPSNIAEGSGRRSRKEFLQFLYIARGSLMELETQLILAQRRKYVPREDAIKAWELAQEVGRMLNGLIASIQRKATQSA